MSDYTDEIMNNSTILANFYKDITENLDETQIRAVIADMLDEINKKNGSFAYLNQNGKIVKGGVNDDLASGFLCSFFRLEPAISFRAIGLVISHQLPNTIYFLLTVGENGMINVVDDAYSLID